MTTEPVVRWAVVHKDGRIVNGLWETREQAIAKAPRNADYKRIPEHQLSDHGYRVAKFELREVEG